MRSTKPPRNQPPKYVPKKGDIFYVTIPAPRQLSPKEQETVSAGGSYPVHVSEHMPEHETFLDYLVERSVAAWSRSRG